MTKHLRAFLVSGSASIAVQADGKSDKRPTFEMVAYTGGALRLDHWYYPVVIDLKGLQVRGKTPVLLGHDRERIVGQAVKTKKTASDLRLSGIVTGDTETVGEPAQVVVSHARNGFEWAVSVGVSPTVTEFVVEGQKVKVNGEQFAGPLTVVREGKLGEVSFVSIGADENASVKLAAHAAENSQELAMTFEQWVEAQGWKVDELTDAQDKTLRAAFAASRDQSAAPEPNAAPVPDAEPDPIAGIRAREAAEVARLAAIRKVCGEAHAEIAAKAISEGWTPDKCELEVLRASRAVAPAIHVPQLNNEPQVIEAALAQTLKLPGAEKVYSEKTLDASHRSFRGGIVGLQHLISICAARNGWAGGHVRTDLGGALRAAFSTADISGILSNVANKFLLAGYMAIDQVWRRVTAIRSVNDFKRNTSYRLTGSMQYAKVAPSGELQHAALGELTYGNQADTYGTILTLTRVNIVNDDLGALNELPMRLGRGAALKINDVFWRAFMDNASFFASGNSNYASGAATALSFASLTAAEALFLKQTDADGKPLGVMPKLLLVPSDLSAIARGYMLSPEYRELPDTTSTGQAAKQFFTRNVHAGSFEPLSTSYLQNSGYTGYSTAAWYLLADPNDVSVIETCFLNGQEAPTIESADANFDVLGIQFRGYHDFGVEKQDYRGGVKMKGTA